MFTAPSMGCLSKGSFGLNEANQRTVLGKTLPVGIKTQPWRRTNWRTTNWRRRTTLTWPSLALVYLLVAGRLLVLHDRDRREALQIHLNPHPVPLQMVLY